MAYYMRFFVTTESGLPLSEINHALKAADDRYSIENGDLLFGGDLYGQIEISTPGDEIFESELEEFKAELEQAEGNGKKKVEATLLCTKAIVVVQVLWQDRDSEETLRRLDPLWEWLISNHKGLMQADGEGFYEGRNLILELE